MSETVIIYPHQLFKNHPGLKKIKRAILVEEPLYFRQYKFHKKKLVLHRASMQSYKNYLNQKGIKVEYIESEDIKRTEDIKKYLIKRKIKRITICDLKDNWLFKKIKKSLGDGIKINVLESPNFICNLELGKKYLYNKSGKPFMHTFYMGVRKEFQILVDKSNKPAGGKWSFDSDNRSKLPKDFEYPKHFESKNNEVKKAINYVNKEFRNNPGDTDCFNYPINFDEAKKALRLFIEKRFNNFGIYQDAIDLDDSFLFHSVLSPCINIGILSPKEVINEAIKAYNSKLAPINSVEGFVRQVLGWREFMQLVYLLHGVEQRNKNYFNFNKSIPKSFWDGTTGIPPIDTVIKRVNETAYANHIERLMVLSNFMLLCRFDPNEVYEWFMALFIDAYDWVMVPNVYGMSLYADGGLITTKPYVSSSNYIMKMSRYKKGDWQEIWDSLYWCFVRDFRDTFENNHRAKMLVSHLDKMDKNKEKNQIRTMNTFFECF